MYIAIPMSSNNFKESSIVKMAEAKVWAIIEFEDGVIKSIKEL